MGKKGAKTGWSRKILRLVFFAALIFAFSSASFLIIDNYVLPYFATIKWLAQFPVLKTAAEKVVVVNKTEQVSVSEDETASRYSNKSAPSVVEIISLKNDVKTAPRLSDKDRAKFGSGLVVTADGLVLTYKDAIFEENSAYRIFSSAGQSHDARLIGVDPFTNLALLKIDAVEDLPIASFIAPEDAKVGAKVVAIGRRGEDFQVVLKSGLLSQFAPNFSLAGPVSSSEKLAGVFMSDFDMSEEKSERMVGGAIADYNGDIVGILGVRKVSGQTQYFVVPVNHAEDLINMYLREGAIKRATLGTYFLTLDGENAIIYGLDTDKGAMIFSPTMQQGLAVIAGSPAEKAGLKVSNIITNVEGEEVNSGQNLSYLISRHKPGEEVDLKFLRDGKEMETKAVLQ